MMDDFQMCYSDVLVKASKQLVALLSFYCIFFPRGV